MLTRVASALRSSASAVSRPAALGVAARCVSSSSTDWLQGRPPSAADIKPETMAAFYYENVRNYETPTKDLLVAPGQEIRMTVGQFDREVYSFANGFAEALGLKKGTKVALWMTNELEHLAVQCAAALTGATVISIDPRLPWDAVLAILKEEDPRAFILSARHGMEDRAAALNTHFAAELERFSAARVSGYDTLSSKRFRGLRYIVQSGFEKVPGVVPLKDLHVAGLGGEYDYDSIAALQHPLKASDAVTVQYTRAAPGTQALDRKTITHAQTLATSDAAAAALGLKSSDTVVVSAPLFSHGSYAAGALAAMRAHAKTVFASKSFDAAATLKALTSTRATHLVATPDQVSEMSAVLASSSAEYNLSTLKGGLVLTEGPSPAAASAKLGNASFKAIDSSRLPAGKAAFA